MNNKKFFWLAIMAPLIVSLVGCNKNPGHSSSSKRYVTEEDEDVPLEIGDTVKEWTCKWDYDQIPLGFENNQGSGKIVEDFGNEDSSSLEYIVNSGSSSGYIGSNLIEKPYFTADDAKNGDVISAYCFLPADSNIASLQLQAMPYGENNAISSEVLNVTDEKVGEWQILKIPAFDTLKTLGSLRIQYTLSDSSEAAKFYIDDICIVLGEETQKTGYEYKDESLCETYEDYFIVGTELSSSTLNNTEMRKITKHNFNSVTAENEAKPEQILDQAACQELAKKDQTAVAIKVTPFEQLYDWCEANHIPVRHHTFVWYSQTPGWFFTENYSGGTQVSREVMLKRMENFIKVTLNTINERWPGLVYAVDVANEAIENSGNGSVRAGNNNWYTVVGEDFVYYAFKYAHKYKAEWQDLYYNDFAYDYEHVRCQFAVNTLLKQVIEEGLIDGVGIQAHIDDDQNMDTMINDAKLIHSKGLKCQLTELDLETRGNGDDKWEKQKNAYNLLIKRILESNEKGETDVNGVILWGITDNTSWKSYNNPLLFDSNYAKKPAYYGFLNALEEYEQSKLA